MKIVICSSTKFKEQIIATYKALEKVGIQPLFPEVKAGFINNPTPQQKHQLALNHFEKIKEADAAYFIVPGGYIGTSCKLELGYAIALEKPIYFSEWTNDDAIDGWASGFGSIEEIASEQPK